MQWGEEGVEDEEEEGQSGEVFPVSKALVSGCSLSSQLQASEGGVIDSQPLRFPPPEPPRPHIVVLGEWPFPPPWGPVVERDFQEYDLHDYHNEGLDEQCGVVAGAGPVEDFEDGGCEHD